MGELGAVLFPEIRSGYRVSVPLTVTGRFELAPFLRDDLPRPSDDTDRLVARHHLGRIRPQPVQDRSEDSKGIRRRVSCRGADNEDEALKRDLSAGTAMADKEMKLLGLCDWSRRVFVSASRTLWTHSGLSFNEIRILMVLRRTPFINARQLAAAINCRHPRSGTGAR